MKRFLIAFGASTLALVVVLALVGVAVASFFGPRIAWAQEFGPGFAAPLAASLPPEIRDLHELPPAERFGHFLGGQLRFTDTNGQTHAVAVTPGAVVRLSNDRLTIEPNDQSGNQTYTLGDQTVVRTAARPWAGGQAQRTAPQAGDKVVIIALDGSDTAHAVMIGGPDGFGPAGGPGWHHGPGSR